MPPIERERDRTGERARGMSGDLSAIAADPQFHEWERCLGIFFPLFEGRMDRERERAKSMLCVCVFCVNPKLQLSSFLQQASSLISQAPGSILLRVLGFHYVSFQAFSGSGAVSHFVLILEVIHRCSVKASKLFVLK
ncbi:hypothetical protein C1H46_018718 [Malus baccata]|uniref:Uncharacterized protein n=1 Tax=Malus baccata TaxID=106549 RepID=A0A540MAC4_MALBA|nr:hypothetical protein C1H46_018718 [Malus baccata]